jgi:hypothetical protein
VLWQGPPPLQSATQGREELRLFAAHAGFVDSLVRGSEHSFDIGRGQADGRFGERDARVLKIADLDDR